MAAGDELLDTQRPAGIGMSGVVVSETYRITKLLGAGGMGEVYEAEHLRLGRPVAVKVLRSRSDERALSRFRRETRVIASLESDHVVDVYDAGELKDGTPYLVMELLRGEDLRSLLRQQRTLSVAMAVRIVREAARGVAAAHRAGIIHRDLKPENLFMARREGEGERCKVLDFGVAKTETSELTQTGTVIGTIKYMAPEQLEDSANVGPATDVYALGVILYECLTGDSPFGGNSAQETMLKILTAPLRSVRERRPDVPEALAAVVEKALARKLDDRYPTSLALSQALEPFVALPVPHALPDLAELATADLSSADAAPLPSFRPVVRTPATTQGPVTTPAPGGRRRTLWVGGSLALVLALGLWWLGQRAPEAPYGEPLVSEQAKSAPSTTGSPAAGLTRPVDLPGALPVGSPGVRAPELAPAAAVAEASEARPTPKERARAARPLPGKPAAASAQKPTSERSVAAGGLPTLRLDRDNPYGQ